jgi:outer membrane protein assembly factor BamE (lipoprotein component of BamABCDE complex)
MAGSWGNHPRDFGLRYYTPSQGFLLPVNGKAAAVASKSFFIEPVKHLCYASIKGSRLWPAVIAANFPPGPEADSTRCGADMRAWQRIITVSLALLFVFSCVSTGVKKAANPDLTSRLETGQSTKADVSNLLGAPTIVVYGPKGEETWNYYYVTEYPQCLDFIPVVDALSPDFYQITKTLTIAYDGKGVLQKLQRTQTTGSNAVYPY